MTREPPRFSIDVLEQAGVRLIAVTGRLDSATAPALQAHLEQATAGQGAVLVDLCAVDWIDATGVRSLLHGRNSITGQGRRFALSCRDDAASRRILTSGLDSLLKYFPDRVTAIAALRAY